MLDLCLRQQKVNVGMVYWRDQRRAGHRRKAELDLGTERAER